MILADPVSFEIIFGLLAGWVYCIGRVFPRISWNFMMIASGLLALFAAAWGFHGLARSMRKGWKRSWTAAWILLGGLVFGASLFTAGMVHHTVWLFREPIVASPYAGISSIRSENTLRHLLLELEFYRNDLDRFSERLYDLYSGDCLNRSSERNLPVNRMN